MIGKTLRHYKILEQLGKGGMGEVYRAKDQKLGRDVAIKVLPEEFANDAERAARFQREAKLLASLNHPNIAAIYGLEEFEGTHFLVLELIEGDTLADRLKRGAIPVEESLKLALQIAEALEAAHEKGVIHRDLKPANIKVTADKKVKVLDFGLAKAFEGNQEDRGLSNSPTLSAAATQQGVILGTAAYMSPEQAKGKSVDTQTDVWAFGAVLYEMVTGQAAFQGEDVTEIVASVVKASVNLNALPENIHFRIREILTRCLQKEQKRRYSRIADVQYEIEQVLSDPSGVFAQPSAITKPRKKIQIGLTWLAAAIAITAIIIGLAVWRLKPEPESGPLQVVRLDYDLPEDQEFTEDLNSVAVSPDGTKIVYVANDQLYLKNLNEFEARPIKGTDENPMEPFFSTDGQWVGYSSRKDTQLKKISIMGGAPVTLCEDTMALGATWGADDMIVFGGDQQGNIMRISANGGIPEEIIAKAKKNESLEYPQILPDGKSVLFEIYEDGEIRVAVQTLGSDQRKELFPGGPPRYIPTGHIVYGLENNLAAIRFDLDSLETIGGPVPLIEDVYRFNTGWATQSAISDSGTLAYIPGRIGATTQGALVWIDREGNEEPIEEEPKAYSDPQISPDGTRVALSITEDGNQDIWIYDLVRRTWTRLTFDEADDFNPIWTPDSQRIIFGSGREEKTNIYWKAADGSGKVERIASMQDTWIMPRSISKDGGTLFFIQASGGNSNIGMLSMEGDRTPEVLLQENYSERYPKISPDGRWLAYQSNESGQNEVFVRPFPDVDGGGKWQVSTSGGENPIWSPDGKELFYINSDAVMAVSVDTDPIFRLGTPKNIFNGPYLGWDISPDGKRFLMIKETETTDNDSTQGRPRKINVVVNWFEELKEKVPVE